MGRNFKRILKNLDSAVLETDSREVQWADDFLSVLHFQKLETVYFVVLSWKYCLCAGHPVYVQGTLSLLRNQPSFLLPNKLQLYSHISSYHLKCVADIPQFLRFISLTLLHLKCQAKMLPYESFAFLLHLQFHLQTCLSSRQHCSVS